MEKSGFISPITTIPRQNRISSNSAGITCSIWAYR